MSRGRHLQSETKDALMHRTADLLPSTDYTVAETDTDLMYATL